MCSIRQLMWVWRAGLAMSFAICLSGVALGADNVWSVQTLNDNKPWTKLIDATIHVEGRIGNFGGGQLRLLRCDAKFIIDTAKLKSVHAKNTVEVIGRFKKEDGKVEFAVDDLKVVAGYSEQYETRASKIKRGSITEWVELGEWAARLGHFYDDAELMKKAETAYTKSIEVEFDSLSSTDAEGRFSLAKKMDELKLSPRRRMELIHEGLRIQWQALQKADPPQMAAWEKFANGLADVLPGTTEPLTKVPKDLKASYEQDAVAAYRKGSDEQRHQLHRLLYVSITRKRLLHEADPDGKNGDSVADQIEQLIPEEAELAEQQRVLRLKYRVAHVSTETRDAVEDLAAALRSRGQNDSAKQALVAWIKSHELRLKGDGVIGLLQLADEHMSLLNNEATAVEYLTDAYRIDPTLEDVTTKLNSLGYQYRKSRWMKVDPNRPDLSTTANQAPTEMRIGMTATDVRQMLGQPGSLSRAVTSRGITEVWSFGPVGGSRLVVRLEQKGRDSDPKVVFYSQTK